MLHHSDWSIPMCRKLGKKKRVGSHHPLQYLYSRQIRNPKQNLHALYLPHILNTFVGLEGKFIPQVLNKRGEYVTTLVRASKRKLLDKIDRYDNRARTGR